MTATRVEMLTMLVQQLNHFDEKVGYLLRSNRKHIVVTKARIVASYAHIEKSEKSEKRGARLSRMKRSFSRRAFADDRTRQPASGSIECAAENRRPLSCGP